MLAPGGCFAFTVELAGEDACEGFRLLPNLRNAHSEADIRRLAATHGFIVRDRKRAPLRKNQQAPVDALYVYLEPTRIVHTDIDSSQIKGL